MKIDYIPSLETQVKIMQANKWFKDGITIEEIARRLGYTPRYVRSLRAWWKKEKEKNEKA